MTMDLKDKKTSKNKRFLESLFHALMGVKTVIQEERNMAFHVSFSVLTIIVSFVLKISAIEWLFILVSIFLVLITEIINTSFENLVDLVTNHQYHEIAKKVKDMAASSVLLAALLALLIGAIIFIPKIWQLIVA